MSTTLFLLLYLSGLCVFAKKPPDCVVVHLEHVRCSWNNPNRSAVSDRLYGSFAQDKEEECSDYLEKNDTYTECRFPYKNINKRFLLFSTRLFRGEDIIPEEHDLQKMVKLNPPSNLTVKLGPYSNLWFYWNQTAAHCVESEVRYRSTYRKWASTKVYKGEQYHSIHLPSSKWRYELQVRSQIHKDCGGSVFWSEWCDPVAWGSDSDNATPPPPMWSIVFCVVVSGTIIMLAALLLQRDRLRLIFIGVVPKPFIPPDIENWLQISKGLKEGFKTSYNDLACPVREFSLLTQAELATPDLSHQQ